MTANIRSAVAGKPKDSLVSSRPTSVFEKPDLVVCVADTTGPVPYTHLTLPTTLRVYIVTFAFTLIQILITTYILYVSPPYSHTNTISH